MYLRKKKEADSSSGINPDVSSAYLSTDVDQMKVKNIYLSDGSFRHEITLTRSEVETAVDFVRSKSHRGVAFQPSDNGDFLGFLYPEDESVLSVNRTPLIEGKNLVISKNGQTYLSF